MHKGRLLRPFRETIADEKQKLRLAVNDRHPLPWARLPVFYTSILAKTSRRYITYSWTRRSTSATPLHLCIFICVAMLLVRGSLRSSRSDALIASQKPLYARKEVIITNPLIKRFPQEALQPGTKAFGFSFSLRTALAVAVLLL